MAKKQGLQPIVGNADNSLIQASYRMAMANVPKDLSGIHNRMTKDISAGMAKMGAGFGALAGAAIKKGMELSKQAENDDNSLEGFSNGGGEGIGNKIKGFFGKIGDFVEDVFDGGGIGGVGENKAEKIDKSRNDNALDYRDGGPTLVNSGNNNSYKSFYVLENKNGNDVDVQSLSLEDSIDTVRAQIGQIRSNKDLSREQKRNLVSEQKDIRENMKNSALSFSKTSQVIDDHLANGNVNMSPSNAKKFDFLKAIKMNGEADKDGNKAIQGFDGKGNMMFTYVDANGEPIINPTTKKPYHVDAGAAKDLVTVVYEQGRTKLEEISINASTLGKTANWTSNNDASTKHSVALTVGGKVNNFNDLKAYNVRGVVNGEEKNATLESYLNGGDMAASSLSDQMWSVLSQDQGLLARTGVEDANNDGPTADDFSSVENYRKLVNAIIDHENPAFNLQVSTGILGEFVNDQSKSLHRQEWNASPLNKNSSSFTPSTPSLSGTLTERREQNNIKSFTSQVEDLNSSGGDGERRIELGDEGVLFINKNGEDYTLTREYYEGDAKQSSTEDLSIDQAFVKMSKSGLLAKDELSSVYSLFKNSDNSLDLSKIKLPTDDNEAMGALKQLRFEGKENFSYDTDMLDGNQIDIKYIDPNDKSNIIEKTFKTSDKAGIEDFLNNPDPLNPNT